MNKKNLIQGLIYLSVLFIVGVSSCKKILDEKPNRSINTITHLKDLHALLDAYEFVNNFGISLADIGADDYTLTSSAYSNLNVNYRNAYRWDASAYLDGWSQLYRVIYYANTVLQGLTYINEGLQEERNNIEGKALFLRSFAFYQLSQIYCKAYASNTQKELGLPLRLTPNVEEHIYRSSLENTYRRILDDATRAADLLPTRSNTISRPNKLACYALLSRVYLSMRDYTNAEKYSSIYLGIMSNLMDYNELDMTSNPGIPRENNVETVFIAYYAGNIPGPTTTISPDLLESYHENDLRKKIFFSTDQNNITTFKGSYEGNIGSSAFCGFATDEIYLIHAECLVHLNRLGEGIQRLNQLLKTRYKNGTYIDIQVSDKNEGLELIRLERRKELIFRSLRWSDLRRFALEGNEIELVREVDGNKYILQANDRRWAWLIPQDVIKLSGIQQNER